MGSINEPLLPESTTTEVGLEEKKDLSSRVWIESKKLWQIVGPAIFSRIASYTMNVVTQAFAGHLGEVELAAISIANTVIVGFNFGLLVIHQNSIPIGIILINYLMYQIYDLHVLTTSRLYEAYSLLDKETIHISDASEQSLFDVQKSIYIRNMKYLLV